MKKDTGSTTDLTASTATDHRKALAHETVQEFGAGYLNPLVGDSAAETCGNVEAVVGFLHRVIDSPECIDEARPGIALILQTIWTAMQYEQNAQAARSNS